MKKLLEHLNAMLIREDQRALELRELRLSFTRKEKEMLRDIQLCRKSGGVIGIYSRVLGKGMFLCSVLDILENKTLVLRPIHPDGNTHSKTLIDVSEISCICPFNQVYTLPSDSQVDEGNIPSQLNIFQRVN